MLLFTFFVFCVQCSNNFFFIIQNETIIIDEPEEGEIVNSDDDQDDGEFEYEAISSDEELALRKKIEALEARNLELEKIASISAKSKDVYGSKNIVSSFLTK